MNLQSLLLLIFATGLFSSTYYLFKNEENQSFSELQSAHYEFQEIQNKYGFKFDSTHEEIFRLSIMQDNIAYITKINNEGLQIKLGVNQFILYTNKEFIERYYGILDDGELDNLFYAQTIEKDTDSLPKLYDWRTMGAVTPVVDQGVCRSGWAISAVSALESLYFIEKKELLELSTQQLISCDTTNEGCFGGNSGRALSYTKNKGIMTAEDYPYEASETLIPQKCQYDENKILFKNQESLKLKQGDQNQLAQNLLIQPIAGVIEASSMKFQFYKSGTIMSKDCGKKYKHYVQIVGYNQEKGGKGYWIIKNTWGVAWGSVGFAQIYKEDFDKNDQEAGTCGILLNNYIPKGIQQ